MPLKCLGARVRRLAACANQPPAYVHSPSQRPASPSPTSPYPPVRHEVGIVRVNPRATVLLPGHALALQVSSHALLDLQGSVDEGGERCAACHSSS